MKLRYAHTYAQEATPEGTINYSYNGLDQHTETWTGTGSPSTATTDTLYSYDVLGRLDGVTIDRLNGSTANVQDT
jgi:hypothetical protein